MKGELNMKANSLRWKIKYSRYNPYNIKYLIRHHEWDIKFKRILRSPFMWLRYYLYNYIKYLIKTKLINK